MNAFDYDKWQGIHNVWNKKGILTDQDALLAVKWFPDRLDFITAHAYERPTSYYSALMQDLGMINSIWAKVQTGIDKVVDLWPTVGRDIFVNVERSIEHWVKKLHAAVRALALALSQVFEHVSGFSIGIGGFPLGFSVSISFSLSLLT